MGPGLEMACHWWGGTTTTRARMGAWPGAHFCIGAPLSRLEARVALPVFLERVKGFALASDAPWAPRQAIHVLGPARLPLRVEPGGYCRSATSTDVR